MLRWLKQRFKKKEKSCDFRFHPEKVLRRDTFGPRPQVAKKLETNLRDNALNHIYEEIQDPVPPKRRHKAGKKNGKKVHFLETKCHSVSDISQIPRDFTFEQDGIRKRAFSLVNVEDACYNENILASRLKPEENHPEKPPRKNGTSVGTRRWHTMLEKSETRPPMMTKKSGFSREMKVSPRRGRMCITRYGDNSIYLEPTDSDSGYENSNCSSNGSDVIDFAPVTGYEYYLSKIDQLRMLEEEVNDLMHEMDMSDISEAHKVINSRLNSPETFRRCRTPEIGRQRTDSRRGEFSLSPETFDYGSYISRHPSTSSADFQLQTRSYKLPRKTWISYENTAGLLSKSDRPVSVELSKDKVEYSNSEIANHERPHCNNGQGVYKMKEYTSGHYNTAAYLKRNPRVSILRHHTLAAADVNNSPVPVDNRVLRDLIRNNNHKQYFASKM